MTIGELAERSGVTASALRFYERRGLLASRRTLGNQRRYPKGTLRRVAVIRAAQALGITLRAIRGALDTLPDRRTPTQDDWERLALRWTDDLESRMAKLDRLRRKLTSCIQCGCLSLETCSLYNPGDRAGRTGPGAHGLPPYPGG